MRRKGCTGHSDQDGVVSSFESSGCGTNGAVGNNVPGPQRSHMQGTSTALEYKLE